MTPAPAPHPRSSPEHPERPAFAAARARLRAESAEANRVGPRMRIVVAWMLGLAILEAGQASVRLLVGLLPEALPAREPPILVTAAYAGTAVLFYLAYRGLKHGVGAARGIVAVAVLGTLAGTYAALNSASALALPEGSTRPLVAISESWRGVGFPGMLFHAGDFSLRPSGVWHVADVVAAGFAAAVGLTIAALTTTGGPAGPDAPSRAGSPLLRLAGFLVALHLAAHAALTAMGLVGLVLRVVRGAAS